jgi:hypothetical protein
MYGTGTGSRGGIVAATATAAKARVASVRGAGLAGVGKIGEGLGKLSCMAPMPSIAGLPRLSSTSCLDMCPLTTNMCPHTTTDALYSG